MDERRRMKAGTMDGLEKKQGRWMDERRRIKAGTMDESRDDGWIREP